MPSLHIIYATGENNILGVNNDLFVKLKEDLQYFKLITSDNYNGKPNVIVMGYNTWCSLPNKLNNRINVIITNNHKEYIKEESDVYAFNSFDKFMKEFNYNNYGKIFIIGGASIYKHVFDNYLDSIQSIYETFIHDVFPDNQQIENSSHKYIQYNFNIANMCYYKKIFNKIYENDYENSGLVYNISTNVYDNKKIKYTRSVYNWNKPFLKTGSINNQELQYLNLLNKILKHGKITQSRNSEVISIFGEKLEFDLRNGFPILTTKRVPWKTVLRELLWFMSGSTNNQKLLDMNVHIWSKNASKDFLEKQNLNYEENDLGPVYGFQWRHFGATYTNCNDNYEGKGKDQLKWLINEINTNPTSRRLILNSWNANDIDKMALPPCHVMVQFHVDVEEGMIDAMLTQRSGDMFLGVPFNITSYALLLSIIGELTNYTPRKFIHILGDAHIYKNHIKAVETQLRRIPNSFPKLIFKREISDIDDINDSDINILEYEHYSSIKAEMIA